MDNLLQRFEICFSSPEDYLDGSVELRNNCLHLNEELFSYCYDKTGRFPTGPLCILHTKGFDNEQIWEQIQLLNEPTIKYAKKKIKEIANMKICTIDTEPMENGNEMEDDDEVGPLDDNDEENEEDDCQSDDVNSNDMTSKQAAGRQDMFFNLSEMNRFLQDEDRKYENRLDSKQDADDDIDLFREMSSEEEDNDLMYGDFFDPPNEHEGNSGEENDSEGENDSEEDEINSDEAMDVSVEQQLSEDEDDSIVEDTQLSTHQKQQQKVMFIDLLMGSLFCTC